MDKLKQTLKKSGKSNRKGTDHNDSRKIGNWTDLSDFVDTKAASKVSIKEMNLSSLFQRTIQANFKNGECTNTERIAFELTTNYIHFHPMKFSEAVIQAKVLQALEELAHEARSLIFKQQVSIVIGKMQHFWKEQIKQKQEVLKEFEQIALNRTNKQPCPTKAKQNRNKIGLSTSLNIFPSKLNDSEGGCNKKEVKNDAILREVKSMKRLESNKLQSFLKEARAEPMKFKKDLDGGAVLEASRSNIQSRNKTANVRADGGISKIGSKKNQGFIFYRPKRA